MFAELTGVKDIDNIIYDYIQDLEDFEGHQMHTQCIAGDLKYLNGSFQSYVSLKNILFKEKQPFKEKNILPSFLCTGQYAFSFPKKTRDDCMSLSFTRTKASLLRKSFLYRERF